eukprot:TRINITY_DN32154_c0_g1_i1.p1 TRINITY_DN32154_c0_g1~~TRINITY_DN32154_c0_g1_i1.p1  ORF type:complete len:214 (-),score=33.58 TRINITY_DN32154_c0_g1_i1:199-840(-)
MAGMDRGAFDSEWYAIEDNSCLCSGCFCCNHMCGPAMPTVYGQGKVCCAEIGLATAQDACGDKGCLFGVAKLGCCVVSLASSNMACGCCDVFVCGAPYGEESRVEDAEMSYMEGVHWCCYALIGGIGCVGCSPCIGANIKICCAEAKATTGDACCDDTGCIGLRSKFCCCVNQVQCPPSRAVGLGCCCVACVKRDRIGARSPALRAPAMREMA